MKKKIFLTIAIMVVLTCLFALCVGATRVEDYNDTFTLRGEQNITHYQKWFYNENKSYVRQKYTNTVTLTFVDENGAPLTEVPMWEYDEEEGKYYSLVWYISDYEFTWEDQIYSDANVGEQTYPKYTAAEYTLSKARAVDLRYVFNQYNTTHDVWKDAEGTKITYSLKSLKGIYHTNGTEDTSDDLKLQHAVGIGRDNDNYGYVGYDAQFAATGNKIVVGNFRDCDFERDEEGNYGTSNTWSSATALQCLWYPDTMKYICAGIGPVYEVDLGDGMEVIACQVLRDNKRVTEFKIPNSCLFINNEAFRGSDLTTLRLGESLITHGDQPFMYTGAADNYYMSKNILSETYTAQVGQLLAWNNSSITIYFDGDYEQATALMNKLIAENSKYNGKFAPIDYNVTQDKGNLKNVVVLFYNYNRCDAFYDAQHDVVLEEGNNCCGVCSRCYQLSMLANPIHTESIKLGFGVDTDADGIDDEIVETVDFYANMYVLHACEFCKTEMAKTEEYAPVFVKMGYSAEEEDTTSISFFTASNKDSLAKYEEIKGTRLQYGLIVSAAATSSPIKSIVDGEIELSASTVKVSMTDTDYAKFSVRIAKLPANQSLNCCGYVVENDKVTYLGHATASDEAEIIDHSGVIELTK